MANATQQGVHDFEKAGLGKAPFRIVGVCDKVGPIQYVDPSGVTVTVGAPGQPMGVCKFCGQGIMECWSIKSSDGKVFEVGCDCVRRTGDAGMRKVIDAHKAKIRREKAKKKGEADREYVDSVLSDESKRAALSALPHPNRASGSKWFATATALDYAEYMRKNSGNAGIGRVAKALRSMLK